MKEAQEDHGTRSRGQPEIAMPGSSSWMPYAPHGVKGLDDDADDLYYPSNGPDEMTHGGIT